MVAQETSAVPFSTASLTWLSLQPTLCPRSFQNWRLWFSGVEQAGGQDGTGESRYQGCCFSNLNFHMLRGELKGPLLFAGHRDGRERSGAVSSWPKGFKAGWGGEAGAPENWRNSVCGVEGEGCRNEGHCCCRILKIGKCILWVESQRFAPSGSLLKDILKKFFIQVNWRNHHKG